MDSTPLLRHSHIHCQCSFSGFKGAGTFFFFNKVCSITARIMAVINSESFPLFRSSSCAGEVQVCIMVFRHSTLCRFKKAVIAVVKFQANTHTHTSAAPVM